MGNDYVTPVRPGHRGYTADLFRNLKDDAMRENPLYGSTFFDDFKGGVGSGYVKSNLNSATATFAPIAARHGVVRIDVGATTNHHGGQVQLPGAGMQCHSGSSFAWETLIRGNAIGSAAHALVGLAEVDTSLLDAAGAIAVDDFVGFVLTGDDLNLDFHVRLAGASATVLSVGALVNTGWVHLGFRCERGGLFVPYVNGVKIVDGIIQGASLAPTEVLLPSWAIVGSGTVQPTLDIDWHKGVDSYAENVRAA